jgi:hypothetical protein
MADIVEIAIVGSGPGGISAAARAAELKVPHVLLEAAPHLSNTIYRYQKGKHVMDEPGHLPLRSPLPFTAGSRESILDAWDQGVARLGVNVRHGAEVSAIKKLGRRHLRDQHRPQGQGAGEERGARHRPAGQHPQARRARRRCPLRAVQLDDPDEYEARPSSWSAPAMPRSRMRCRCRSRTTVIIVNRRDEFARAKEGNLRAILKAIEDGSDRVLLQRRAGTRRGKLSVGRKPGRLILNTPKGKAQILCDRIIAPPRRHPPRSFVEACGVVFPSKDPSAVPAISEKYESNVPGLYIVGALGGYPLIKQAMNQGYEVVEYILGNKVEPADEPLLRDKFRACPGFTTVEAALARCRRRCRCWRHHHAAAVARVHARLGHPHAAPGEVVFERNDYTNSFYCIVEGKVESPGRREPGKRVSLKRRRVLRRDEPDLGTPPLATVFAGQGCVLVETPRRSMNRADQLGRRGETRRSSTGVHRLRAIRARFAPEATRRRSSTRSSSEAEIRASRPAKRCSTRARPAMPAPGPRRLADHLAQGRRARDRAVLCAGRQLCRRDGGARRFQALGHRARGRRHRDHPCSADAFRLMAADRCCA